MDEIENAAMLLPGDLVIYYGSFNYFIIKKDGKRDGYYKALKFPGFYSDGREMIISTWFFPKEGIKIIR